MAQCTAKKEPGNPDKDLGTSSVAHKERRGIAYATAYDALNRNRQFQVVKRSTRVALRGVFHVACLLIMFYDGRLAMPYSRRENVRHVTSFFFVLRRRDAKNKDKKKRLYVRNVRK